MGEWSFTDENGFIHKAHPSSPMGQGTAERFEVAERPIPKHVMVMLWGPGIGDDDKQKSDIRILKYNADIHRRSGKSGFEGAVKWTPLLLPGEVV